MTFQVNYVTTQLSEDVATISCNPFTTSPLSFPLEDTTKHVDKDNIYTDCPVWNHKAQRTFLVRSPIDFTMQYDRETDRVEWNHNLNNDNFFFFDNGWNTKSPVVQTTFPSVIMWTKQRNIWVEARPHAHTSGKNNIVAIGGWWNLSQWVRTINFAFQFADETQPVTIKRGDPLYEICLYNQHNLNDKVKLTRHDSIPDAIARRANANVRVKQFVKRLSPDHLFQSQSKCPFAFLKR